MNERPDPWNETARVLRLWGDELARLFQGRRVAAPTSPTTPEASDERSTVHMSRHLYRSRDDRMIRGVCAGLAEYAGLPTALVRIAFVLLALPGVIHMVIIYALLAILIPEAPHSRVVSE